MSCPRNFSHRRSVFWAVHSRRISNELAGRETDIDVAPSALTATAVEPRGLDPALAQRPLTLALRPHPDRRGVPAPSFGYLDAAPVPGPPPSDTHNPSSLLSTLLSRTPSSFFDFQPQTARNRRKKAACRRGWVRSGGVRHPRERHKLKTSGGRVLVDDLAVDEFHIRFIEAFSKLPNYPFGFTLLKKFVVCFLCLTCFRGGLPP